MALCSFQNNFTDGNVFTPRNKTELIIIHWWINVIFMTIIAVDNLYICRDIKCILIVYLMFISINCLFEAKQMQFQV